MSEEEQHGVDPKALFDVLAMDPGAYGKDRMQRYREFRRLFLESEEGLRVLHEILRQCGVNKVATAPGPVDSHRVCFNDGMRNVGLWLIGTIMQEPVAQPAQVNRTRDDL